MAKINKTGIVKELITNCTTDTQNSFQEQFICQEIGKPRKNK